MRARHVLCATLLILHCTLSYADEDEELPPLELLGFIADFSDEQGWVDPRDIEDIFDLGEPSPDNPEAGTRQNIQRQQAVRNSDNSD